MKQFTKICNKNGTSFHLITYLLLSSIICVFTQPIPNEEEYSETKSNNTTSPNTITSSSIPITSSETELTKSNVRGNGILRLIKRDVQGNTGQSESSDPSGREEDESSNSEPDVNPHGYEAPNSYPYPMMLSKRSATVLNKLVHALKTSFDQPRGGSMRNLDFSREKESLPSNRNNHNYELFNLQRRNQKDRKNYLRCYFNAVSCF